MGRQHFAAISVQHMLDALFYPGIFAIHHVRGVRRFVSELLFTTTKGLFTVWTDVLSTGWASILDTSL